MTTATAVSPTLREGQLFAQTVVVIGGSSGIGLETARRARAEEPTSSSPAATRSAFNRWRLRPHDRGPRRVASQFGWRLDVKLSSTNGAGGGTNPCHYHSLLSCDVKGK